MESDAYIMVLFLDEYEFAIFRSKDLIHWEESQRFSIKPMRECPDLFELPVDNSTGERKWVFWSADGYYVVGSFDGYCFTPESEVQCAYSTIMAYAAQTYAGITDRVISIAWLRLSNDRGNYKGAMSLPMELSLLKSKEDYRLRFQLTKEFLAYQQLRQELVLTGQNTEWVLNGISAQITITSEQRNSGGIQLNIGDTHILICFDDGTMTFSNPQVYSEKIVVPFDKTEALNLDFIIDQEVIEFLGNNGLIYGAVETEENILRKKITMTSDSESAFVKFFEIVTK